MSARTLQRLAVLLGVLVVAAVAGKASLSAGRHLAATNARVIDGRIVLPLRPGRPVCQDGEPLDASARLLRVRARQPREVPGAPFRARYEDRRTGAVLATAEMPAGYGPGPVTTPIRPRETRWPVRLCLEATGDRTVLLEGNLTSANPEAPRPYSGPLKPDRDQIRVDLVRGDVERRLDVVGRADTRFALFRPSFVRSWTLWAVLGLTFLTAVLAVATTLRDGRPGDAGEAA